MPIRIQRQRTKGWRMPKNTVSVTRSGRWGNPFVIGEWYRMGDPTAPEDEPEYAHATPEWAAQMGGYTQIEDAAMAVEWYESLITRWPDMLPDRDELRGKNVACFCPLDQPCHGDVILRVVNR